MTSDGRRKNWHVLTETSIECIVKIYNESMINEFPKSLSRLLDNPWYSVGSDFFYPPYYKVLMLLNTLILAAQNSLTINRPDSVLN